MRYLILLLALCLTGCVQTATLDELKAEAMQTGDWSEVERREKIIARRIESRGVSCPIGYSSYCENFALEQRCACVPSEQLRDIFVMR